MINNRIRINRSSYWVQGMSIPNVILFLMLGIMPLLNGGFDHDILYWVMIISSMLLLVYVAYSKKDLLLNLSDPDLWIILMIFWSLMSIVWSIYVVRTIIEWLQLVSYGLVFLLIRRIPAMQLEKVIRITLIAGTGVAMFGIFEYIFLGGTRIESTFPNSNPLGIYLAMLFLLAWGGILHSRSTKQSTLVLQVLSIVIAVALVLSGSRGSYLSLVAALPWLLIGLNRNQIVVSFGKIILCISISLILANEIILLTPLINANPIGITLFESMARSDSFASTSVAGRWEFWNVAVRLISLNPLWGFGLGTFFSAYYIAYSGDEWYSRFAHNHYLQTAVETGLVGLLFLLMFLFFIAKKAISQIRNKKLEGYAPGALAACIAFLLHIGVDFSWNIPAVSVLFFALSGIIAGSPSKDRTEESSISKNISPNSNKKTVFFRVTHHWTLLILFGLLALTAWQYTSLEILEKGIKYQDEQPQKALNYVHFANSLYPYNCVGLYIESNLHLNSYKETGSSFDFQQSLFYAGQAVKRAPYDSMVLNHLGRLYWQIKNYEKAEYYLQLGSHYGAFELSRHLDLARFYNEVGKIEAAKGVLLSTLDLIEATVKRSPPEERTARLLEAANIHYRLAEIFKSQGNYSRAAFHLAEGKLYLKMSLSL